MRAFFTVFLVFCRLCYSSSDATEEFYILPMGQGNSQLIVYNTNQQNGKIGFLYDMGSKSLQTHPKFAKKGEWRTIYSLRLSTTPSKETTEIQEPEKIIGTPEHFQNIFAGTPGTTEQKSDRSLISEVKNELNDFIKELLKELKHLFIFISHTDIDHINKFNNDTIPDGIPITVFLCGDWFGDVISKTIDQDDTSTAINKVLDFFLKRQNTYVDFPYYWGFKVDDNDFNSYVKEKFASCKQTDKVLSELKKVTSKVNYNTPCPKFFSGTLNDMIKFRNNLEKPSYTSIQGLQKVMNNIFIWSINLPVSNVNDFSPIISCTLPSINLSVVLTGEAGVPVFQSITSMSKKSDFRKIRKLSQNHLVLLMLPHHGSSLNIGGEMLRFFTPNIFGIAAGDGGQHGHPSLDSIEWIQKNYKEKNIHCIFYNLYEVKEKYQIIAIKSNEEKQYTHKVQNMNVGEILFLCPNIYGCIKWNKDGIYCNFDNTITLDSQKYCLDYTTHLFEKEGQIADINTNITFKRVDNAQQISLEYIKKLENDYFPYKYLLTNNNLLYIGIPVDTKIFVYKLIPIQQEKVAQKRLREE